MKFKKMIPTLALALILFGCSVQKENQSQNQAELKDNSLEDKTKTEKANDSNSKIVSASDKNIKFSPKDALNKAKEKYPNGKINSLELSKDKGSYLYEIEIFENNQGYDLYIDPITGEIVKTKQNYERNDDEYIDENVIDNIMQNINKIGKDSSVEKWSLDYDKGINKLEIELSDGNEYTIDASSGEIIEKDD